MKNKIQKQIEKELVSLDILRIETLIIPIKNTLDEDLSNHYSRGVINTYTFKNYWNFSGLYDYVFDVSPRDVYLFHSDSLSEIALELNLNYDPRINSTEQVEFLNKARAADSDVVRMHSMDEINDEFKIHCLLSDKIDNVEKEWIYKGNFDGDEFYIDSTDFGIYSEIEVKAIDRNLELYKFIIAESYLLFQQKNYKLANFLLYTVVENFFSTYFQRGRLKQLIENFEKKYKVECLKYFKKLKEFERKNYDARKGIAHGSLHLDVSENVLADSFITILKAINEIIGNKSMQP